MTTQLLRISMHKYALVLIWIICINTLSVTAQSSRIDSLIIELGLSKNDTTRAIICKNLWHSYINTDLDSAMHYAHLGLKLSEASNYPRGISDHTVYIAFIESRKGNHKRALNRLKKSLYKVKNEYDFVSGELFMSNWIANIYRESGQLDSAAHYLNLMLQESRGRHFLNAIEVNASLGQLYQQQHFYRSALLHYQRADSICQMNDVDNNSCTLCIANVGVVLMKIKDYENALKYFERATKQYESRNEIYLLNELDIAKANLEWHRDSFATSIILADKTVKYFRKDSSILNWAQALRVLLKAHMDSGQLEKAGDDVIELIQLYHILNDSTKLTYAYTSYANWLNLTESYQLAEENIRKAKQLASGTDDILARQFLNKVSAGIYSSVKNYDDAYNAQSEFIKVTNEYRNKSNERLIKDIEISYDVKNKDQEIRLLNVSNDLMMQKQNIQKRLMWGGLVVFLLVMSILYYLYLLKQNTNQKLKEIDKLKSRLFADISHEFRTPLTLIKGPIEMILEKGDVPIELRNQLSIVDRNTNKLNRLVDSINDLTLLQSGEIELNIRPSNLKTHLKIISASFESMASVKGIQFNTALSLPDEYVYYDPKKLESILYNLLSNAFKFTSEGEVSLTARIIAPEKVELQVKDTGIGLSEEDQQNIFKRYFRVSSEKVDAEGIGIGLALASELAKLHMGSISLSSQLGVGSVFTLELTISRQAYENTGLSIGSVYVPNDSNMKTIEIPINTGVISLHEDDQVILLVEDNVDMRRYLEDIFSGVYQVLSAENGEKGLQLADELIPDLIISDLMMPVMDGMAFLKAIKTNQKTSHIPFVMLTADHREEAKLEGLQYGADDFMTKPFSSAEIQLKVQNLIEVRKQLRAKYKEDRFVDPEVLAANDIDEQFWVRLEHVVRANLDNAHFHAADFARAMYMSRMQLHRKLKATTNLSTSIFLRSQRLKAAAQMLRDGNPSVADVAYAVGFTSPSFFSKCFKEVFGVPPNEYVR